MLRPDPFINGEYYHLYNRGIDKRIIFKTSNDFKRFIMLLYVCNSFLEKSLRLDNLINHSHKSYEEIMILDRGEPLVSIGAWCLMDNHFHLLIRQEVDGGITKFMKKVGTAYAMFFNIKYQRKGALFGGLFKSKLIGDKDNYLIQLLAYIHLNSLDIKFSGWDKDINNFDKVEMKKHLDEYLYSSYQEYIGMDRIEKNILNLNNFPSYFTDIKSFTDFVENYFNR